MLQTCQLSVDWCAEQSSDCKQHKRLCATGLRVHIARTSPLLSISVGGRGGPEPTERHEPRTGFREIGQSELQNRHFTNDDLPDVLEFKWILVVVRLKPDNFSENFQCLDIVRVVCWPATCIWMFVETSLSVIASFFRNIRDYIICKFSESVFPFFIFILWKTSWPIATDGQMIFLFC